MPFPACSAPNFAGACGVARKCVGPSSGVLRGAGLRFLQDDNGKGNTSEDARAYIVGNGISRTGVSATWDGFPLSHKTRKDGAPSCPRVVCASMSEDAHAYIVGNGISRTVGSAPHVRAGSSTADSSRLKPLGMTMRKGSCSAPFGLAQGRLKN